MRSLYWRNSLGSALTPVFGAASGRNHIETWAGCIVFLTTPTRSSLKASRSVSSPRVWLRRLQCFPCVVRPAEVAPSDKELDVTVRRRRQPAAPDASRLRRCYRTSSPFGSYRGHEVVIPCFEFLWPGPTGALYLHRWLSLLVSNLFSTSSKAPGSRRAPPAKGWSMTPMVNSTRAITPASAATISLWAHVLSKPKR